MPATTPVPFDLLHAAILAEKTVEAEESHLRSVTVLARRAYSRASSVLPVPAAPSKRQRGLPSSSSSLAYCSSVRRNNFSSMRPTDTPFVTISSKSGRRKFLIALHLGSCVGKAFAVARLEFTEPTA